MSSDPGLPLAGRVAMVTGAAGGIGSVYARELARAGAAVALADVRPDGARSAAADIVTDGHQAIAVECDVTSEESWKWAVDKVGEELGGVDILVNNAALMAEITTSDMLEIAIEPQHLAQDALTPLSIIGLMAYLEICGKQFEHRQISRCLSIGDREGLQHHPT